jgi:hypothetical protein
MKAIITKKTLGNDSSHDRIAASDMDGNTIRVFESTLEESSDYDRHLKVAIKLQAHMGWDGCLIGGAIKGGYAFVFVS